MLRLTKTQRKRSMDDVILFPGWIRVSDGLRHGGKQYRDIGCVKETIPVRIGGVSTDGTLRWRRTALRGMRERHHRRSVRHCTSVHGRPSIATVAQREQHSTALRSLDGTPHCHHQCCHCTPEAIGDPVMTERDDGTSAFRTRQTRHVTHLPTAVAESQPGQMPRRPTACGPCRARRQIRHINSPVLFH